MPERIQLSDTLRRCLLAGESLPAQVKVNGKSYTPEAPVEAGLKGGVWRVRDEFGRLRALKLCMYDDYQDRSYLQELSRAAALEPYKEFAHFVDAGLTNLSLGELSDQTFVCFIEEWIDGFTLEKFLSDQKHLVTASFLLAYVHGICNALSALKAVQLRHDDLHTRNVMLARAAPGDLSSAWTIKVIDTGSIKPLELPAKKPKDDHRHFVEHLVAIWNTIHAQHTLAIRDRRFLTEVSRLLQLMLDDDPSIALLQAARALGQHVLGSPLDGTTRARLIAHMQEHIDTAERLGATGARVFVERALVARLQNQPADVLRWAEATLRAPDADTADRADALIARLEALARLGQHDVALALDDEIQRLRLLVDGDARLALDATWLLTLCEAGRLSRDRVQRFADEVRGLVHREAVSRRRAAVMLGDVAAGLNRRAHIPETLELSEVAYEIGEPSGDARMATTIALQIAELAAQLGDAARARLYLGRAESWAEGCKPDSPDKSDAPWLTLRAIVLFARGRTLARLGDKRDAGAESDQEILQEAYRSLDEARSFAGANRHAIHGDVEIYLADVSWWFGRVAEALGRPEEAAACFRAVRSEVAMAHPHFSTEVGMEAWLCEAEALRLAGRLPEASEVLNRLLKEGNRGQIPERIATRARAFREYLDKRELPFLDWFNSIDARTIAQSAVERSLHHAVAEQLSPLVSWWEEWHEEKSGPESELFDFWGRGGFARVTAAVRARPHAAIAVDARSIDEIRQWARIFCPLFDTVLVKWKGSLGAGMVIAPMHWRYGGPGSFGGHGYSVTAGTKVRENWTVALGWANPLPREVTVFLASEALPLVRAGRLVVVPAPLVGCTQSAIGWTDDLLVSSFLSGVVNAAQKEELVTRTSARRQRILDLSSISIPFIDGIGLVDLARVLEEIAEWVHPLRELLLKSIYSEDLKWERWERIAALENEIQEACRLLQERLTSLTRGRKGRRWKVTAIGGALSAGTRSAGTPDHEAITDLLRALAPVPRELAPWVPYWRLAAFGGHLNWTGPLDNPSRPPDERTNPEIPRDVHGWLYPGTPGWGFAVARRAEI